MKRMVQTLAGGLLATAFLAGCGSEHGPTGDLIVPLSSGEFSNLGALGTTSASSLGTVVIAPGFRVNTTGFVLATVDWTSTSNTVVAGIFPASCTPDAIVDGSCAPVLGTGNRALTLKSSQAGGSLPPGDYALGIVNLGPGAESGTFQVVEYLQGSPSAF
jgi:hypothetical protein